MHLDGIELTLRSQVVAAPPYPSIRLLPLPILRSCLAVLAPIILGSQLPLLIPVFLLDGLISMAVDAPMYAQIDLAALGRPAQPLPITQTRIDVEFLPANLAAPEIAFVLMMPHASIWHGVTPHIYNIWRIKSSKRSRCTIIQDGPGTPLNRDPWSLSFTLFSRFGMNMATILQKAIAQTQSLELC